MALPQEIKNRIVEQVDDLDGLRACSLAHRCLTWAAQRELHRSIRFKWTILQWAPLIKSNDVYSNPNIAAFVTELSLVTVPLPEQEPLAWEVMSRLTNVKVLNLTQCFDDEVWLWITHANRDAILATFPNVETLRIANSNFCHADDLLFLLSAFPKVTTLRLQDVLIVYWPSQEEEEMRREHEDLRQEAIENIPCRHLRRLEMVWYNGIHECSPVEHAWEPFLEKWIFPLSEILEPGFSLEWCERWQDNVAVIFSGLAEALGPVLQSLDVELSRLDEYDDEDFDCGVPHCEELESIKLPGLCQPEDCRNELPQNCDGWALEVLSRVTSTHLRSITLGFAAVNVDDFRAFDLPRLNSLLTQPHLADATVSMEFLPEILTSGAGAGRAFFTTISRELSGIWKRRGICFVHLEGVSRPPLIHKPWGLL